MTMIRTRWFRFKFKLKQYWCRHPLDDSILLSKELFPEIPCTAKYFVYVENHRQCKLCEAYWVDNGFELTIPWDEWLAKDEEDEG